MLRKSKVTFFLLILILFISGCINKFPNQIKADYIDISYGQSFYEGYGKVDNDTVQELVKAYNQLAQSEQTNQEINYDKAITVTYIDNDRISGTFVIDDKGVIQLGDGAGNYQIEPDNEIYEHAQKIFNDVKSQY